MEHCLPHTVGVDDVEWHKTYLIVCSIFTSAFTLCGCNKQIPTLKRFYDKVSKTCDCFVNEWVTHAKLPTLLQHATFFIVTPAFVMVLYVFYVILGFVLESSPLGKPCPPHSNWTKVVVIFVKI